MSDTGVLTCRQAQRLLALAPSTPLPRPLALRLAEHRDACPQCVTSTVEVQALAPPVPLASGENRRLRRQRVLALRFLVACALIFALAPVFDGFDGWRGDPTLAVVRAEGPVFVGGQRLDLRLPEAHAWRSDLIETGPGGCIQLHLRGLTLVLHQEGELLVESVLARRLRHRFGRLEIEGRGRIDTAFGRLELESGAAVLETGEAESRVTVLRGDARFTNASGTHRVRAGELLVASASGGVECGPRASDNGTIGP
jgi:hypothetical protein